VASSYHLHRVLWHNPRGAGRLHSWRCGVCRGELRPCHLLDAHRIWYEDKGAQGTRKKSQEISRGWMACHFWFFSLF
jgi:hypothetical protein